MFVILILLWTAIFSIWTVIFWWIQDIKQTNRAITQQQIEHDLQQEIKKQKKKQMQREREKLMQQEIQNKIESEKQMQQEREKIKQQEIKNIIESKKQISINKKKSLKKRMTKKHAKSNWQISQQQKKKQDRVKQLKLQQNREKMKTVLPDLNKKISLKNSKRKTSSSFLNECHYYLEHASDEKLENEVKTEILDKYKFNQSEWVLLFIQIVTKFETSESESYKRAEIDQNKIKKENDVFSNIIKTFQPSHQSNILQLIADIGIYNLLILKYQNKFVFWPDLCKIVKNHSIKTVSSSTDINAFVRSINPYWPEIYDSKTKSTIISNWFKIVNQINNQPNDSNEIRAKNMIEYLNRIPEI